VNSLVIPIGRRRRIAVTAILVAAAVLHFGSRSAPASQQDHPPAFKIFVEDPGVYRVSFEELAAVAESPLQALESSRLSLTHRGKGVPIWVADGGDGRLDPGDHLEFVGERLPGTKSFYNEHTRRNVYVLSADVDGGARMTQPSSAAPSPPNAQPDVLVGRRHLEQEMLLVRFAGLPEGADPELWYWAKLTHLNAEPFVYELDLSDLDPDSSRFVSLKVKLRGWSHSAQRLPIAEHRVEIELNGVRVGSGEWRGQDDYLADLPTLPLSLFTPGANTVSVRVPRRTLPDSDDSVIDVSLINWIEIEYPRRGRLASGHARIDVAGAEPSRRVELAVAADGPVMIYGDDGSRRPAERLGTDAAGGGRYGFRPSRPDMSVYVVAGNGLKAPASIALDLPSSLRDRSRQADYLLIAHRSLREAAEPLAEFHRARGLSVAVIDVEDIYDEFNHGIFGPQPIRDFISFAYHEWRKPSPRFVLLVGDASWDIHNARPDDANYADWTYRPGETTDFVKNASTTYFDIAAPGRRNLIPAAHYDSPQGHAASDNYFVSVEGDDYYPDLAIGRFPVTEPEEVGAIVDKTIAYAAAEIGPWNRRILWIANEDEEVHRVTDRVAAAMESRGFLSRKIYPSADEADNRDHQARLREAFDDGQLLVHFFGHGGRYIWRTGPPDFEKNHDLFTLEDLERLAPTSRLPVVLSMTCYSAPFDHPTADSIGEKFLRLPSRGSVAVFAASWRNTPNLRFSNDVVEELTHPGTVGEAIVRAKRRTRSRVLVETYNLLGDPAIEIAVPAVDRLAQVAPPAPTGGRASETEETTTEPQAPKTPATPEEGEPARPGVHANTLSWTTASEVDNFGFDIYRATAEDGPFTRINADPVPGAGTTDTMREYEFADDTIDPCQEYFYYVESISLGGVRERFTPIVGVPAKLEGSPRCGGR